MQKLKQGCDFKLACWIDGHFEIEHPKVKGPHELVKVMNAAQVVLMGEEHTCDTQHSALVNNLQFSSAIVLVEGFYRSKARKQHYGSSKDLIFQSWEPKEWKKELNKFSFKRATQLSVHTHLENFCEWLSEDDPKRTDEQVVWELGQFLTRIPDNPIGVRIAQAEPKSQSYKAAYAALWNACDRMNRNLQGDGLLAILAIAMTQCITGLKGIKKAEEELVNLYLPTRNVHMADCIIKSVRDMGLQRVFVEAGNAHLRPVDAVSGEACRLLYQRLNQAGISYVVLIQKQKARSVVSDAPSVPIYHDRVFQTPPHLSVQQILDHYLLADMHSWHEESVLVKWLANYYKETLRNLFRGIHIQTRAKISEPSQG